MAAQTATGSEGVAPAPLMLDFSPGQSIAGRYKIIRPLGRGGMGVVYEAWDAELQIKVAIKTLLLSGNENPLLAMHLHERFRQEILLARQVSHRNVVRIHDIGEASGRKYITMGFIEGETLAGLMRRVGALPLSQTLALGRQIAAGLAAAHDVGVIHRDLKPENIMVTPDGQAVVMDFGIARLLHGTQGLTGGAMVGTLEYMAPEQALGGSVDERTDVYALGLVLYDALLGRRRLLGQDNTMSELVARTSAPPPWPRSLGAALPESTEAVVMRCLEPDPAARFATGGAVFDALIGLGDDGWSDVPASPPIGAPTTVTGGVAASRVAIRLPTALTPRSRDRRFRIVATLVAVTIAGAAGIVWRGWSVAPAVPARDGQPISVLIGDFENTAGDPTFDGLIEQALAIGIESSTFIDAFPRRDALRAAARLPGGTLSDTNARLVAMREGVPVVVSGRIERANGGYRLAARAIDPNSERTLLNWTTEAETKEAVLPTVGRLATRLRNALGDTNANVERIRIEETFTASSLEAARAYIQGQEMFALGQQAQALDAYRQAVRLDPEFGRAWTGIGAVANNLGRREEAENAYGRALSLLDRMTEREQIETRGAYHVVTRNADKALEENEALVQRFPSDASGLTNLAVAYFQRRDFAKAAEAGARIADIYPNNVLRRNNLAFFELYGGRFAVAEPHARRALELNALYPKAHVALGMSLAGLGRLDEAAIVYQQLRTVAGGATFAAFGLSDLALYRGRLTAAADALEAAIATEQPASIRLRLQLALAEVRLAQQRLPEALKLLLVRDAVGMDATLRFETGRLLLAANRRADAGAYADVLVNDVDREAQSLGGVLRAGLALAAGDAKTALVALDEARARADSWLVRFSRARAFLAAGRLAEADSELELCQRRHGEAAAVFMDDIPTWRYMASLKYYQAVARAGLGSPVARAAFEAFLALKAGGDETGGLVAEARRRLDANQR